MVCTYHFLKKKNVKWICGNDITEIGGKKNCCNWFEAMPLPKQGGKFCGNCGNAIAENGRKKKQWLPKSGKELKKKVLRPQYFYNKSHVISY